MDCNPPMPEPIITPVRSKSSCASGVQPESSTACCAAATPYRMKSSTLRRSFGAIQSSGLNVPSVPSPYGTSQAYLVATRSGSNRVIGPAPDWPSRIRVQLSSTPLASGVTIPSPVTTTRRILLPFLHVLDRSYPALAYGGKSMTINQSASAHVKKVPETKIQAPLSICLNKLI